MDQEVGPLRERQVKQQKADLLLYILPENFRIITWPYWSH